MALVGRFLVGEGILQLLLPRGVGAKFKALSHLTGGVELQQLLRQLYGRPLDAFLYPGPFSGAEAG